MPHCSEGCCSATCTMGPSCRLVPCIVESHKCGDDNHVQHIIHHRLSALAPHDTGASPTDREVSIAAHHARARCPCLAAVGPHTPCVSALILHVEGPPHLARHRLSRPLTFIHVLVRSPLCPHLARRRLSPAGYIVTIFTVVRATLQYFAIDNISIKKFSQRRLSACRYRAFIFST
jgi:hypothetical protein